MTAAASKDSADVKAVQDQAAKDAQEASNTVVSENKLTREEADAALTSAKANVVATGDSQLQKKQVLNTLALKLLTMTTKFKQQL